MLEKTIGTKEFPDKIDITDPCYNRDVWCRINNFPISAGKYECYVTIADDEETNGWGERVAKIGIRKDAATHYECKGTIGVDAGLAGFFINKPDYSDERWHEFCDNMSSDENAWIIDEGFYSNSGYGDGAYSVYAGYRDGKIVEVYIDFIEEDEEE